MPIKFWDDKDGIKYQKAYCSWYTGKMEDSKQLWIELYNDENQKSKNKNP